MISQVLTKRPSIMFVIASLANGGAEKVMSDLANIYSRRGVAVTVVTLDNEATKPDACWLDPEVHRVSLTHTSGGGLVNTLRRFTGLRRILRENRPGVLVSFMTSTNILAVCATRCLETRCVVSERSHPKFYSYGRTYSALRALLCRKADQVVVQTNEIALHFQQLFSARISVVPNFLCTNPPMR